MNGYSVTFEYDSESVFKSEDLVEATRFAVASALHTGRRFAVQRDVTKNGEDKSTPIFAVSPTSFDFRRVSPDVVLTMKAMAHELVSNIDEVAPRFSIEGPSE